MTPSRHIATSLALSGLGEGLRAATFRCCWPCWEDHDRVTVATEEHSGEGLCDDCYDAKAEGAYERQCESFYGGSAPVTFAEREAEARRLK